MKKLLLLAALLLSSFHFAQNQPGQFNYLCDDNNDGYATFLMLEIGFEISGNNPDLVVTHHLTQSDAMNGVNPLPANYTNIVPNQQAIFARVLNTTTGNAQVLTYQLHVFPRPVVMPFTVSLCDDNNDGFMAINLDMYSPAFTNGDPNLLISYHPTLQDAEWGANPISGPYVNMTPNMQVLYVRAENLNTACYFVTQFYIAIANCEGQPGQPGNLTACTDGPNLACFDLTQNTPAILANSNPANYTVTYHVSQADANTGANPLQATFCPPVSPYTIYARLASNDGVNSNTVSFTLTSNTVESNTVTLPNVIQCDDNNDGVIIYNLTNAQAQINTANALAYYNSLPDAQNMVNAIGSPAAFTVAATTSMMAIFVRETVVGGCDKIYTFMLQSLLNCNMASACGTANSLCSSLGLPFANTVNVPQTGPMGCLGSTPNPTWFYLPISAGGNIQLTITQVTAANNQIDVDYIIYGPFSDPVTPCSNMNQLLANIVSCSYSPAAIENALIANAQAGQFYLMMVTNFANQPGQITINQTNLGQPGSGLIDCSGLRLQAFLDANTNGIKDNGEQNFPLGQFHYEKNNNGIVHHITAPSGFYDINEMNPGNSYDVSFTVDAAYAAMYTVSPSSYNNLTVAVNSGLTIYNFPVTSVQNYNDLAVTIVPLSAPRPGFTYQNKITYANLGNQNIASGTLTYNKDANVTITGNTQTGTIPTATGFTYDFSNLAPFEERSMTVTMQVPPVPTVNAGDFLTSTATVAPLTGDILTENNASTSSQLVINAYDPNDKMEAHGDRILHSSFTSNDYLYYTIRFENTGTANAINVRVTDVLDSQLDEATLRMVSASHSYELDRVGNSLTWRFDDIQLPVSVANTNIGKGYITFKIKPRAGYAVGDIITNAASIYFDFNPAIVTNLFQTQFVSTMGVDQFAGDDFVFYPNPASDVVTVSLVNTQDSIENIRVYDLLGKTIRTQKATNVPDQIIDLSDVGSGMYFIEVTTQANLKVVKKLMVR